MDKSHKPKLIYICSPLRGDVEVNIFRAKEYAREVFLQGDIPICPQIYFPQFVSVADRREDMSAMEMGLALLAQCGQINVYAWPPTEGMKIEINAAAKLGIPIRNIYGKERQRAAPSRDHCR